MSIFGRIKDAIFGKAAPAAEALPVPEAAPAAIDDAAAVAAVAAAAAPVAISEVDVEAILNDMADSAGQKLNWRTSIVDLMKLQTPAEHPHGLDDRDFDALFTTDRPVIFAFHGYPSLIHRLTYKRSNHAHIHVHGYREEGSTTTPFDMTVLNKLDRFSLVSDAIDRVPHMAMRAAYVRQAMRDRLIDHRHYVTCHGDDLPAIRNWRWGGTPAEIK